jgi:hypothetical protein
LLAFALLLAMVFGGASALALERRLDTRPQQTVEVLNDGLIRNQTSSDASTVTITGPAEVPVGESATFVAGTAGVKNSFWIAPNGDTHRNVETLEVTARTSGGATVTLVGIDGQGRTLQVAHSFQAVES